MLGLLWVLVIGVLLVGFLVVAARSVPARMKGADPDAIPGLRRTVFTLKLGDIVQFDSCDWVVEGVLVYDEAGFQWLEYLLQDQAEIRWLSVEEDDRIQVLWMAPYSGLDVSRLGAKQLEVGGDRYQLEASGTAQMTRRGNTLNRQAEICCYYDYVAEGGKHLTLEDWEGDVEVTLGQAIQPRDLNLLPGDGERVYNARA